MDGEKNKYTENIFGTGFSEKAVLYRSSKSSYKFTHFITSYR